MTARSDTLIPQQADDGLYRLIVESAADFAIMTTDVNGNVLTWNPGAEKLTGYQARHMIGRRANVIFVPEDLEAGVDEAERKEALERGRAEDERWHVRNDGSRFWASGLMMPLRDRANEIRGLVKILRDRTDMRLAEDALRSSEERLRLILRSATDYAIFTVDALGRIASWNPGACHLLGYEEHEIIGADGAILFTPEDRENDAPARELETARTQGRAENERWHLRKDGSRFWASGLTMPLRVQDGPGGFLKILRDQTDRHRLEEHQQILMREVSHRVKNSLSLVASMLSLQARASQLPEVRRAIGDAEARVATIAQVHDQLWRQRDVQTVELDGFLRRLCAQLEQAGPAHRLALDVDPVSLDADRGIQLALLVNELVTNSFKHAFPEGSAGQVSVSLKRSEDGIFRLEVADNGCGLPQGFDPAAASTSSLGMKVVNGLARQLAARLEVVSGIGGSSFVLQIPANKS